MYVAFGALALAVLVQGVSTLQHEQVRAADARILELAGSQRTHSQQIGRSAAMMAAEPAARVHHANELAALMAHAAEEALLIEDLLARQMDRSSDAASSAGPALEAWHAARERLWYRSELLLRQADSGSDDEVRRRVLALQAQVGPALEAAQQLSSALQGAAEQRAERLLAAERWGIGALLALLVLLGAAVVEPAARSVHRHGRRLAEQATELQRLALVAEHTSALVLITDRHDQVVWVNEAFCRVSGWTLAEALGRRPGELLGSPHADEAVLFRVQQAIRLGQGARQEWLHRTRDGRDLWLDVDLRPLQAPEGGLGGYVRVCSDVNARVHQQAKLQTLWSALPAGVVVQAPGGEVVEANRAAERLLDLTPAQMQGTEAVAPGWLIVSEDGSPLPLHEQPAMRTLATGQALRNETLGVQTAAGSVRWLLVNTEPQRDGLGQIAGVVTCYSDITERRALQERLSTSARTDALTRLPNRAVVMERLERAIDHARRHPGYGFAVLFMDFDRFKQVNDTLGHGAGDELLRQIADRLERTLRPGDALARMAAHSQVAARMGGDEFVVVLEGVHDAETVTAIAQRLLNEVAEPYLIDGTPVQSSASIGVVLCADAERDTEGTAQEAAEEVLRNADTAMYEAKRAGRGRWVMFDNSMHERLVRALALENDLRRALKADELFVVYQPVVDLATRAVVGVEALVRWRHPTRGLVSPIEFIAAAEESGLIDAVGSVVLGKACTQFMAWRRTLGTNAPRQLAVNLSRAQLERGGVVDEVRAVLQGCGMRPEQLQLEVTESLAAQDERVQSTLRELKQLGVRLALDDFGTGYSSLACLHQMPVDTVKIDRSFIRHAEDIEYHRVLIEATIRVAATLGMTTVAEGIETEGQAALMLELHCDRGQGFLFSRPLEHGELERWVHAQAEFAAADTLS